jgi:carbamoyl-phosphate synthase large subunit
VAGSAAAHGESTGGAPPLDRPRVLWIGAAGTATAFGLLRSARDAWGQAVRVVAADTNPRRLVAAAALADEFEQVPPVAAESFADHLVDTLARHGTDTYAPILDAEIVVAARLREEGRLPAGLVTLAPSAEVAGLCLDKLEMAQWLEREGLPSPPTAPAADARWDPAGVVVKPRTGFGSTGVAVVDHEDDLTRALERAGGDAIVQRRCEGPEVTVDAFRGGDGRSRAVCRERVEVKAGVSTKARVFDDPEIEQLARALAEGLDLRGASCFQLMRAPGGGRWEVTDVNPRPGAGTRLSAALGVDVLAATLADAWGLDPSPFLPPLAGEGWVVRAYRELVV